MKCSIPKIILISLLSICISGCVKQNFSGSEQAFYEQVASGVHNLTNPTENKSLQEIIAIKKKTFRIEEENDLEKRLTFQFQVRNLTDQHINIAYIGYFPKELNSYYLSREFVEFRSWQLKPLQTIEATQSMVVQHEDNLPLETREFLKENGHIIYFEFLIDEQPHYIAVDIEAIDAD
ncbi:hypothetical protein [Solibacillus sp. FSL W8-0372]|uniref:hypothetical protein n=1 Tax=Solibacillus sp. FSL W8-0372 TaxID=2921713 RepID=UPI0030D1F0D7